jgi:hypothetical protein
MTLKEALKTDIKEVWDIPTHFGQPLQLLKEPHAVVKTVVDRKQGLRYCHEMYQFEIVGFFKLEVGSVEEQLMEKADLLIQKLNPYTLDENALPEQGYNGGFQNYVTKVEGFYREEVDLHGIRINFSVFGLVFN